MTEFLVFTLAARMAAMGGLAGHERRGTNTWPGRSALIGLLGAARGVRRDDTAGQEALGALSFAVAAYDTGTPLRDFHTVQTVPQKFRRPATRAVALETAGRARGLKTTITLRDYRCGVLHTIAAWGGKTPLQDLADALARPVFTLYLGRKSCPLSLPVGASVVEAENPAAALLQTGTPAKIFPAGKFAGNPPLFIASDPFPGLAPDRTERRHDEPLDRGLWHFTARDVHFIRGTQT